MQTNLNSADNQHTQQQANLSAGEYLTFTLGGETYGIEILKVQEIRSYEIATKIANTPDFIKGVINLRGSIVPIVDLRMRFNLSSVEYNDFTVVIILNLNNRIIGIVVDSVSDVLALTSTQISPVPDLVASIDTKYLLGLATVEQQMLILLNIEQLMSSKEMALMDAASDMVD